MVNFITYFSVGAENWMVANPHDGADFLATLKAARPSVFLGVNTLYASLIQHPQLAEVDWSRLRLSGGGGAAIVRTVSERWKAITGSFIREGYGLSETSPVLSFNPQFIEEFNGTTGLPLPSTDVKLLDENGPGSCRWRVWRDLREGPAGDARLLGEARGERIGLYGRTATSAPATSACSTPTRFLKIVDRKKDMIIVSGFNVYPNEVEDVATACPGVTECACIGVPDEKTGEAVALFVVKAPESALTEQDVIAHCRAGMVAYKVPKIVHIVEALPKSAVGKILRRELRQPNAR